MSSHAQDNQRYSQSLEVPQISKIQTPSIRTSRKRFSFLKGQEQVITLLNIHQQQKSREAISTTTLLGLSNSSLTKFNIQSLDMKKQQDNIYFKKHSMIQDIFQKSKHQKTSSLQWSFKNTNREYHYKDSSIPGVGSYSIETENNYYPPLIRKYEKPKKDKNLPATSSICSIDYYDSNTVVQKLKDQENNGVQFFKTTSRLDAFQFGIFSHLPKNNDKENPNPPSIYEVEKLVKSSSQLHDKIPTKLINTYLQERENPEKLDTQWAKTLEKYGYTKSKNKIIKRNNKSLNIK